MDRDQAVVSSVAKFYVNMMHVFDSPTEEEFKELVAGLGGVTDSLFEYLMLAEMEHGSCVGGEIDRIDPVSACEVDGWALETEDDIRYGAIAEFLLSLQPMGKLMDFDDAMHYRIIISGLRCAPVVVRHVLGVCEEIVVCGKY